MDKRLNGQRVLVTQSDDYMGPATIELFQKEGAEIIADSSDLSLNRAAVKNWSQQREGSIY